MSGVFVTLLNMSITAGWLILAVILIRLLLRKAPKWISCALWALVAVRLICPISLQSSLSLIPAGNTIPTDIALQAEPRIDSGITAINEVINPVISSQFMPNPMASANPLQIVLPVLSGVWMAGMLALLVYALVSYIRIKRSVAASIPVKADILACDEVKSPFILGVLRPVIYVPSSLKDSELDYVIIHEKAHLSRRDHWWKPLGYLLLTVYWFNPLCWLAYTLLCRDIELACDEKVIRDMDNGSRANYSQALLNCSYPRRRIAVCPLAFGEVSVKERVKSVLNYKKPAFRVIVIGLIICAAAAACLLTDPVNKADTITYRHDSASIGYRADFDINFGRKARSALLSAELWQNGKNTAESTMRITSDTRNITVLFTDRRNGMSLTGEDVQIDTNQTAGSLMTFFPVPEGVRGWSLHGWKDGQSVNIEAGSDLILAAMNFDMGSGTRSVFELMEKDNSQMPADIDCVLIIRARFFAEELPGIAETTVELLIPGAMECEPEDGKNVEMHLPSAAGKYICEQPGYGGDFVLTLYPNGEYRYSEGPFISRVGIGRWSIDGTRVELTEAGSDNRICFTFNGMSLLYDKRASYTFTSIDLADDTVFFRAGESSSADEPELSIISAELLPQEVSISEIGGVDLPESLIVSSSSTFQRELVMPLPGMVERIMDNSEHNRYAVFLTGVEMERAKTYTEQLKAEGYEQAAFVQEAGIMSWLLEAKDAALSIAYDGYGQQMSIMVSRF